MPEWYKRYDKLLKKYKRISRANTIHLWHEETLARMKARMMDLELRKKGVI